MTTQAAPQTYPSIPLGYWLEAFRKYATFSGRARRAEYWSFTVVNFIVAILFVVVGMGEDSIGPILYGCFALATIIPGIAVNVRRLHDSGRSGWYMLLGLIPIVNLIMLYYALVDSQPGANQYGPNPKGA
jgi:uncharacterized membrane protein YhaH (DUF805 family)